MNDMKKLSGLAGAALLASTASWAVGPPEQNELVFGFIKLTDMAPLAVAHERGYFADEGLDVLLEAQANWGQLLQGVVDGTLDGAHMLAPQPLAARIGYGDVEGEVIVPLSLDLNGNAITVSNAVWEAMGAHVARDDAGRPVHPIGADALKPLVDAHIERGETFKLAMVHPASTHNYELRYWLAAGGIHPGLYDASKLDAKSRTGWIDAEARLYVAPPPQMPRQLADGRVHGYCVGEPWNQQAVASGTGVPVVTDHQIWSRNPEKVFGLSATFAEDYPNTTVRIVRALLRAGKWLDENDNANRPEAVEMLARPEYVGAPPEVLAASMTGTFEFERGDRRPAPDFNVFFRHFATYPYYSDAVWFLTQMRRWGQIAEARTDEWYLETARSVYRPDIYATAARELVAEGLMEAGDFPVFESETGMRSPSTEFIDAVSFDAREPNAYLRRLAIGNKD
ncbi:MAG: CmpA/NrtA family ABC transporter substrate-binding protein [Chromatiales bacterium]|nr:CmpA/NrtA family ABC transporter substrate-binding protein [Chromatiales bacterium]